MRTSASRRSASTGLTWVVVCGALLCSLAGAASPAAVGGADTTAQEDPAERDDTRAPPPPPAALEDPSDADTLNNHSPPAAPTERPQTQRPARAKVRAADREPPLPPPDAPARFDLWATAGLIAGCAVCGGVPLAIGAGLTGVGLLMLGAAAQSTGCGAVVGIIIGIYFMILGVIPTTAGGITAPIGAAIGGTGARLISGGNVLPTLLGPLLGLVSGLLGVGTLVGLAALASWQGDANPPWLVPVLSAGAVGLLVFAMMAGPLAIAGGVGAIAAWPLLLGEGAEPSTTDPARSAPARADAKPSAAPLAQSVAMAF